MYVQRVKPAEKHITLWSTNSEPTKGCLLEDTWSSTTPLRGSVFVNSRVGAKRLCFTMLSLADLRQERSVYTTGGDSHDVLASCGFPPFDALHRRNAQMPEDNMSHNLHGHLIRG